LPTLRQLLGGLFWTLAIAVKIALLAIAAVNTRYVMDELALLQWSGQVDVSELYKSIDPIKTVLTLPLFRVLFRLFDSSLEIVEAARWTGLLCAVVSLTLIGLLARRASASPFVAAIAVFTATSFSNFFEQSFRVRTDTVALPFALASCLALTGARRFLSPLAGGLLVGAAFLCTQKAVYFVLAFGVALVASRATTAGPRRAIEDGAVYGAAAALAVGAYALWFGGASWANVVSMVFEGPRYIIDGTDAFSGLRGYVWQTLERNTANYLLCMSGLVYTLVRWRRLGAAERFVALATLGVTVFLFVHSQPWPYVFVWPQAMLAVFVSPLLDGVSSRIRVRPGLWVAASVALLSTSLVRNVRYLGHDSRAQLAAIAEAEANLGRNERYFDGIGMVVSRAVAGRYPDWWWDTPTLARLRSDLSRGDDRVLREIEGDRPKLYILNYRFLAVEEAIARLTRGGYVKVSDTLLLAGVPVPARSVATFRCRWPGEYALFDVDGRSVAEPFVVDDGPAAGRQWIGRGEHRIEANLSDANRILLPADARVQGPLPRGGRVPQLFANVYDY
jgi:hypothetical protein